MAYRDSIYIDASVPTVFAFFADPDNFRQAEPGQIEFTDIVVTARGVGTHYAWATKIVGIPFKGKDVYTEFVPDELITDRSSSALEGTWTYTFTREGSGTRLTVENRVRSVWSIPPLRQLLDVAAAKSHRPRFERIKAVLER